MIVTSTESIWESLFRIWVLLFKSRLAAVHLCRCLAHVEGLHPVFFNVACNSRSSTGAVEKWVRAVAGWARATTPINAHSCAQDLRLPSPGEIDDTIKTDMTLESYKAELAAHTTCGKWQLALSLLDALHQAHTKSDVTSFNIAISACQEGEQWEEALALLGKMPKVGISADVISFGAAIWACEQSAQLEHVLNSLDKMLKVGIMPDVNIFNTAILACEKVGLWERARSLLYKMQEANITPTTISFSATIKACDRDRQWQQALWLLEEMETLSTEPDLTTFCAFMDVLAHAEQMDACFDLLARVRAGGLEQAADFYPINHVALQYCRREGKQDLAEALQENVDQNQLVRKRKLPVATAEVNDKVTE